MKIGTLLVLLALCLGLGAYIYYEIQLPSEQAELEVPMDERIFPYAAKEIEEIELQIPGQKALKLHSQDQRWMIVEPFTDIPSKTKLEELLKNLSALKKDKLILGEQNYSEAKLSDYSLNPEEALILKIKVKAQPQPVEIRSGRSNPSRSGNYALLANQKEVYLTGNSLDRIRTNTPQDYRENRLLSVSEADFSEIRIQNQTGDYKFVRDANDLWVLEQPAGLPIDQSYTKSQLAKIGLIRANQFLEKKPAALNKPEVRVLIGFKEKVRDERSGPDDPRPSGTEILMSKSKKLEKVDGDEADKYDYYAVTEKTGPASVSRFHYDNFSKSYRDFVKKSFDDFNLSDLKKIDVKLPKEAYSIVQTDSELQWAEKEKLFKSSLERALGTIRQLRAQDFLSLEKTPPSSSDFQVQLETKSGEEILFHYKKVASDEFWWLSRGGQSLKYSLRARSFDPSLWNKAALSTEVPSEAPETEVVSDEI